MKLSLDLRTYFDIKKCASSFREVSDQWNSVETAFKICVSTKAKQKNSVVS